MLRKILQFIIPIAVLSMLTGCASLMSAGEAHRLSDARQIAWARIVWLHEHPDSDMPALTDLQADHPHLDAALLDRFEVTPAWYNRAASEDAIVVRENRWHRNQRVVATAAGEAFSQERE